MAIDNPQATGFVDNYARQIARQILLLKVALDDADREWADSGVQPMFTGANLTEVVQDQNVAAHPVTGRDVVDWALFVAAFRAVLNDASNADKLSACQRLAVVRILGGGD